MEKLTIELPQTPSQNKLHGWRSRYGWRQKFLKFMHNYCLVRKFVAKEKRCVKITRYSSRKLDYGNLVGGCKPLLDALKHAKLIVDDSPDWIADSYKQEKGKPKTIAVITWKSIEGFVK